MSQLDTATTIELVAGKARNQFLQTLRTSPDPVAAFAASHFEERTRHTHRPIPSGVLAPFLLAEVFGIHPRSLDKLARLWMFVYEYALLLDDSLDSAPREAEIFGSAASAFEGVARAEWQEQFEKHPELRELFEMYRDQMLDAMRQQASVSVGDSERPDADYSVYGIGRRGALVKFCAASMSFEERATGLTSAEDEGCDHLSAVVQVLDDVGDLAEDKLSGRSSILLRDIEKYSAVAAQDEMSMCIALVASGELDRVLRLCLDWMSIGLDKLCAPASGHLGSYFTSLRRECERTLSMLHALENERQVMGPEKLNLQRAQIGHRALAIVKAIPKATN